MKKAILALATVATIAASTLITPTTADARCRGCGIGLGIVGGLAAGAIIGSAINNHPGYYAYEYEGQGGPCPGYWARRPLYDRFGNQVGWSKPHWFCR